MDILILLLGSLSVFLLIIGLFSGAGLEADRKKQRLKAIQGNSDTGEQKKKSGFSLEEYRKKAKQRKKEKLQGQHISTAKEKGKQNATDAMLLAAGIPLTGVQFMLIRLTLGLVLAIPCYMAAPMLGMEDLSIVIAAAGLILGMLIPMKLVQNKQKKITDGYRDALPDVMDLLVVSVEAGLGFDASILRLYEKDKGPLMQELMRGIQDVQRGMSKKEAYKNISDRCNVKELTSFLNSLIQAEQMGISIKSVLKMQSESLREARRQRAEEKALKAPTKMLIPMVIFIFPVIFIVLLGPAVMNIMEIF